jgi:hypothetical protein
MHVTLDVEQQIEEGEIMTIDEQAANLGSSGSFVDHSPPHS